MLYVWLATLLVAVVAEALTSDLVAIWFLPGALVSLILSLFSVPWWVQVIVFVALGLILVISTRPLCKRLLAGKEVKTNAEALIGQVCLVTEEICNINETGEVRVGGLCWSARAEDADRIIAVGEQVTVLAIQGVKLIVK